MRTSSRSDRRPLGLGVSIALLGLALVASAHADTREPGAFQPPAGTVASPAPASPSTGTWVLLGVLTGSAKPDDHLADYQWDTSAQLAYGGRAMLGRGPFAVGIGTWRTATTQSTGFAGAGNNPTVHATSWELLGEGRLLTVWGLDLLASASAGWLHLGYEPDEMSIDPGTGTPVVVKFEAVNEWIGGGGLGLRHRLGSNWALGLSAEHRWFGLDTAHRNGSVIVEQRETFGEWSARVEMAWLHVSR